METLPPGGKTKATTTIQLFWTAFIACEPSKDCITKWHGNINVFWGLNLTTTKYVCIYDLEFLRGGKHVSGAWTLAPRGSQALKPSSPSDLHIACERTASRDSGTDASQANAAVSAGSVAKQHGACSPTSGKRRMNSPLLWNGELNCETIKSSRSAL